MKISLITPFYAESTSSMNEFDTTIDSLLAQEDENFEWVIVLDNPPEFVLQDYHYIFQPELEYVKNLNIKTVRLTANYGPSVARNVGIQVAKGDIICYVDIGDILSPRRITVIKNMFDAIPEMDILFHDYFIYYDGTHYLYRHPDDLDKQLNESNVSIPLGFAHTRPLFYKAGMFQPGIVCGEDGLLLRRMINLGAKFEIYRGPEMAGIYNISDVGQSRTQRRFDEGGFAFDASHESGSHGQYLDFDWFNTFTSNKFYE